MVTIPDPKIGPQYTFNVTAENSEGSASTLCGFTTLESGDWTKTTFQVSHRDNGHSVTHTHSRTHIHTHTHTLVPMDNRSNIAAIVGGVVGSLVVILFRGVARNFERGVILLVMRAKRARNFWPRPLLCCHAHFISFYGNSDQ